MVDNGSTDDTRQVVALAAETHPAIRYVSEPRKGKGYAYNTGLAEAKGTVLLFTDDDVLVPSTWVAGMCEPILSGSADAVQGGIRVAPHLDRPWLTGSLRVWVAAVEHPTNAPAGLVGANMAFSKACATRVGGFDVRLGPGAAGFFDDTLFGWEIERQGMKILYRPSVAVEHHFAAQRLTLASYLDTARRMAVSHALVGFIQSPSRRPPSLFTYLPAIPGFVARCITQLYNHVVHRRPDPGFVVRYYELNYIRELRRTFGRRA